jgi:hypothetical protein
MLVLDEQQKHKLECLRHPNRHKVKNEVKREYYRSLAASFKEIYDSCEVDYKVKEKVTQPKPVNVLGPKNGTGKDGGVIKETEYDEVGTRVFKVSGSVPRGKELTLYGSLAERSKNVTLALDDIPLRECFLVINEIDVHTFLNIMQTYGDTSYIKEFGKTREFIVLEPTDADLLPKFAADFEKEWKEVDSKMK